jgi:hypothetical protein
MNIIIYKEYVSVSSCKDKSKIAGGDIFVLQEKKIKHTSFKIA